MTRLWFAPGPVPTEELIRIEYSHRSKEFSQLYLSTIAMLEDWTKRKIVLIQGSASAAIESVLDSLKLDTGRVLLLNNGSFAQRIADRLNRVGELVVEVSTWEKALEVLHSKKAPVYHSVYAVQFETSNSTLNCLDELGECCNARGVPFIVDAVSSFPFYPVPESADIAILSSSKQLRGLPVIGIVAYKKDMEKQFENVGGYLNLKKAIEYGKKGQTPHTSLIPQIYSLWRSLTNESWKPFVSSISINACSVSEHLEDALIGELIAPVLTFQTKNVDAVVAKLKEEEIEVYYNSMYSGSKVQVSCFSYMDVEPYRKLNEELLGCREAELL